MREAINSINTVYGLILDEDNEYKTKRLSKRRFFWKNEMQENFPFSCKHEMRNAVTYRIWKRRTLLVGWWVGRWVGRLVGRLVSRIPCFPLFEFLAHSPKALRKNEFFLIIFLPLSAPLELMESVLWGESENASQNVKTRVEM